MGAKKSKQRKNNEENPMNKFYSEVRWSIYKEGVKEYLLWGAISVEPKPMAILFLFPTTDHLCRTVVQAAKLGGYEYERVMSIDEALIASRRKHYCLMLIDIRHDYYASSDLNSAAYLEAKEEQNYTMNSLLNGCVTRQFFETENAYECLNEFRCIQRGEVLLQSQLHAAKSLLVAVTHSNEAIEITNTYDEILYMNPASERLFGYGVNEMRGQSLKRLTRSGETRSDISAQASCRQALRSGKAWAGTYNIRRRNGEKVFQACRTFPMHFNKPLYHLSMKVLTEFSASEFLRIDQTTVSVWLRTVEAHYHEANEYHNSTHAADVTHATCSFLRTDRGKVIFEKINQVVLILGAIVHDIDHPARTNQSLINGHEPLAILYNDESMLENHHTSLTFQLTLKDPAQNIFKNLTRDEYVQVRRQLIDAILATDMRKHYELLEAFKNCVSSLPDLSLQKTLSKQERKIFFQSRIHIEKMLIKCSDVSNPARPLKLCMMWGERIKNEYISQSAMEIESGIPVSMTAYMPDSCDLPNSQWKFMKAFCIPMFKEWSEFIQMPECFDNVRKNYEHWRKMDWSVPREKTSMELLTRASTDEYSNRASTLDEDKMRPRSTSVAFGNRVSPSSP